MTAVDVLGFASLNAVPTRPSDGRSFGVLGDTYAKDCTTPSSQDGTQILAGWYNSVAGNFRSLIRANGLKLNGVDPVVVYDQLDDMALRSVQQLIQRGLLNTAVDAGSANNVVASLPVTPAELVPGFRVSVQMAAAPTGASVMVLQGFAGYPVKRRGGKDLVGNEWLLGDWMDFRWKAAGYWQIMGLTKSDVLDIVAGGCLFSGQDTGAANAIVLATPAPSTVGLTSIPVNTVLVTTPAAINTGATTIALGTLGARPVVYPTGSAFLGGEMQPRPQMFIYDANGNWEWQGQQSPILQQATTFYVSPGGSDTNNGLTATIPLKTIQAAVNRTALFNLNSFNVTIKLADGGYSGATALPAISGSGSITILGNAATPGNVVISSGTQAFVGAGAGAYTINGVRVITTGNSFQIGPGHTWTLQNIDYGPCASAHITIDGGALTMTGQHNISGGATAHIAGINSATLRSVPGAYPTLNVLIGVTFTNAFIVSNTLADLSLIYGGITGAANVQGTKKFATGVGLINTLGRGINYYPGDTAGTSLNSWEYQ